MLAYSKVATSISSGWWRKFAYENGPKIIKMMPTNYYDKFLAGLASGVVKEVESHDG